MRKLLLIVLLSTCAVAQVQLTPPPSPGSTVAKPQTPQAGGTTSAQPGALNQNENAQKARTLLDQCIAAMGGQAWLTAKDMQQEGRTYGYSHGSPTGMGTLFWRFVKFPDKERSEFTKQRDVSYIYNGDKGYEITFKGTAAMDPVDLKNFLLRRNHSLETVLRTWLQDPKTALFYDGPAIAEQKHTDSVTLLNANNDSVTLFLDEHTHLPIKKQFEYRASDRLKDTEVEVFDNWRVEQGIPTPHSILRSHNGEIVNQRFITTVKYNVGLADKMFEATVNYTPQRPSHPE
jgi:hypothetical protein